MTRDVGRTDDGRYVVVDGRRWRTADPALPDDVRERLLHHLGERTSLPPPLASSGRTLQEGRALTRRRRGA
jgi:hypothetical protein